MRDKETEKFERVGRSYILLVLAAGIILPLVASLIMCIVMGEIRVIWFSLCRLFSEL